MAEGHDPVAERVARNDVTFREANERIERAAVTMELEADVEVPFICECADVSCTELLKLSLEEYEAVRADPTHFLNARGHEVNALGWGRVVDEFDRYSVVKKIGEAGEIAAERDTRNQDPA
jgi:hypothetical protein